MRYTVDARLQDLAGLMGAGSPAELHRALVLSPPAAIERERTVPLAIFRQVHGADPRDARTTAMLMITDPRYSSITGLSAALLATGLVPADDAQLLAEAFVAADEALWWRCPDDWFEGGVTIVLTDAAADHDADDGADDEEAGPTVTERRVPSDARRWAVGEVMRCQPQRWVPIFCRARSAPTKVASGLWLGLIDHLRTLEPEAAAMVVHGALAGGDATVRLAALRHLATTDPEGASARAAADPNARVRDHAAKLAGRWPAEAAVSAQATLL